MGSVFGLVDARGDAWKRIRKAASPPFSLPKIKKFMPYFNKACMDMVKHVTTQADSRSEVDCKDLLRKVVLNILGSVGFGIEADAFNNKKSEFKIQADALNEMWRFIMILMMPSIAVLLKIPVYNSTAKNFFTTIVRKHIEQRKRGKDVGKDILGTLVQIHERTPDDMAEHEVVNTFLQFLFDGYHTTSENIVAVLYRVVVNPEVQAKIVDEIDAVFNAKASIDAELTENDVTGMTYLDSVILEANRLNAIGANVRMCTQPWKIPDTNIVLPVGTIVNIPVSSFQKDPEFWENPEEFVPERFDADNKGKIRTGTYQPFGLGPRQCLGNIYAKFKTKMILIYLLRFFTIDNFKNLPKELVLDPEAFFTPKGGLHVKFIKREL